MGIFITKDDVRQELEQVNAEFEARITQMEERLIERLQPRFNVEQELRQMQSDIGARIEQMGNILLDKLRVSDSAQQESQQANTVLLAEIRKTQTLEAETKDAILQHTHSVPRFPQEIYQTPANVNYLQNRINNLSKQFEILTEVSKALEDLTSQVKLLIQTVAQLSPTLPDGEQKPIHDVIAAHTKQISSAIDNILIDHAKWLDELLEENGKMKQALEALGVIADRSRMRLAPKPQIVEMKPAAIEPVQSNHTAEAIE